MKHQFELTVTTGVTMQQSTAEELVQRVLGYGQEVAKEDADDEAFDAAEREVSAAMRDMEFVLHPAPLPTTQLATRARRFVMDLDEMGFGADESINGGDCVEFVDQNQQLLRMLPALAEVAAAADLVVNSAAHSQVALDRLRAAFDKLKGA